MPTNIPATVSQWEQIAGAIYASGENLELADVIHKKLGSLKHVISSSEVINPSVTLAIEDHHLEAATYHLVRAVKLQVWWIPQVPGKPFLVPVKSIEEAKLILKTLAHYDIFQFENRIKPDYCNAGGLNYWDEQDQEWVTWYDEEGRDIDELVREEEEAEEEKAAEGVSG